MADALTFLDEDHTIQTRLFIRLFDEFFDCLNVTNNKEGIMKRKASRLAYSQASDERFTVCNYNFLSCLFL